jgi:hypothetical protein
VETPKNWCTDVAMSTDLVHWTKYAKNPIVSGDKSSGILVHDGKQYRLYTMRPDVRVSFPRGAKELESRVGQDRAAIVGPPFRQAYK